MNRQHTGILAAAAAAVVVLGGCGTDSAGARPSAWEAQVDTVGDTITVRTLGGSEWGSVTLEEQVRIGAIEGADHEMFGRIAGMAVDPAGNVYVYDSQVPALRKYDVNGRFVATLGRQGGGPGEYQNSDGGLAALPDGRVVLRDPGNARFSVWDAAGNFVESWPTRGGMFTSVPMYTDAVGNFYSTTSATAPGSTRREQVLVRYAPDGTPLDTLPMPNADYQAPTISANSEGRTQIWIVPFAPSALWTFHPDGHFLAAIGSAYAVDAHRQDGKVLRVARNVEPVPILPEERRAREDAATTSMRNVDPNWRWNGPAIPATKPLLRSVLADRAGRIWVQLAQPGEPVPEEELDALPPGQTRLPQFRERLVYDVFEGDGRYLGEVRAPRGLQEFPQPVITREHVWAVARDELGVQYLVRYGAPPAGAGAAPAAARN